MSEHHEHGSHPAHVATDGPSGPDAHRHGEGDATEMFEPHAWDERYAGDEQIWSGRPNAQLVTEASALEPADRGDLVVGEGEIEHVGVLDLRGIEAQGPVGSDIAPLKGDEIPTEGRLII